MSWVSLNDRAGIHIHNLQGSLIGSVNVSMLVKFTGRSTSPLMVVGSVSTLCADYPQFPGCSRIIMVTLELPAPGPDQAKL